MGRILRGDLARQRTVRACRRIAMAMLLGGMTAPLAEAQVASSDLHQAVPGLGIDFDELVANCDGQAPAGRGASPGPSDTATTAIVGATVIDGTGAPPLRDATVLITGRRIAAVGPRRAVAVPAGAQVLDGAGRFVLPGFVDVNVHLWSGCAEKAYHALQNGVTTIMDTYGPLEPLQAVRDSIQIGLLLGARLQVAGNIVGWTQENVPAEGAGQELVGLAPDSLRVMIDQYLDKGPGFIKYGATSHSQNEPARLLFDERAQRVLVEEAHKRGLLAETHAISAEAMRMAVRAGVDLIQHPEVLALNAVLPDDVIRLMVDHGVICAINAGPGRMGDSTGSTWQNAARLIRAGCTAAVASDLAGGGKATRGVIEGLVRLGMTPMGAIVAATANGAKAAKLSDQIGTVQRGKLADLVVLKADPLLDIGNINAIAMVFKEGQRVTGP